MRYDLSPRRLLSAYMAGVFPMSDDSGRIHWLSPDPRAVIALDNLKVSRSLRAVIRRRVFDIRIDTSFEDVLLACADRPDGTWISHEIVVAYCTLRELGYAHSVEAWQKGRLVGGLYGVAIGGAFFGESMFHRVTDASKAALAHLVDRMRDRGMTLLDVQFLTGHLESLGAAEIPRAEYLTRLQTAIRLPVCFATRPATVHEQAALTAHRT